MLLKGADRALAMSRGRAVRAMLQGRRESLSAQRTTLSGEGLCLRQVVYCITQMLCLPLDTCRSCCLRVKASVTLSCCGLSCYRSIVERLSVPGVRRLFVVDPDTRRMEGIVSLSDVAAYLFDVF